MTISAKIICDSVNNNGNRLTTMQLRYPRWIHNEFMTHRVFSRNASSSRAIPVKKLIQDIIQDPVYPSFWGSNKPGMQAGEEIFEFIELADYTPSIGYESDYAYIYYDLAKFSRETAWDIARKKAIEFAEAFDKAGYHKQIVNRLLEPFSHINVVCTATEYENFFHLRRHPDAQPEIKILADAMWTAMQESTPKLLQFGEWHLPYVTNEERNITNLETLIKISVSRCARVSYLTHDGRVTTIDEDSKLYDRLVGNSPLHASPAEHQATPDRIISINPLTWKNKEQHGNFVGYIQYRKTLPNEYVSG